MPPRKAPVAQARSLWRPVAPAELIEPCKEAPCEHASEGRVANTPSRGPARLRSASVELLLEALSVYME